MGVTDFFGVFLGVTDFLGVLFGVSSTVFTGVTSSTSATGADFLRLSTIVFLTLREGIGVDWKILKDNPSEDKLFLLQLN